MTTAARVLASIVTCNSARYLRACLDSVRAQTHPELEVRLWDNASTDGTRAIAAEYAGMLAALHLSEHNIGFSAAHNRLIAASAADYVLVLNPDVLLDPRFVEILLAALRADPGAGAATGKLRRMPGEGADPAGARVIDTAGIYFTRNQRHLDRGSGERDRGQYDAREYVFGASGAAAFYRRAMLEDVRFGAEYFDESFFAYREDADLAWRAQWLGWSCLYVPQATGWHARRVLPERRASLPAEINMHSFKNRFLLRIKNMDAGTYARNFLPITARDLLALGYVLLRERSSLRAFPLLCRALPHARRARADLWKRRRAAPRDLRRWFADRPVARPAPEPTHL